jgi:hypothetical protein
LAALTGDWLKADGSENNGDCEIGPSNLSLAFQSSGLAMEMSFKSSKSKMFKK